MNAIEMIMSGTDTAAPVGDAGWNGSWHVAMNPKALPAWCELFASAACSRTQCWRTKRADDRDPVQE
jgi:hypothetical protein